MSKEVEKLVERLSKGSCCHERFSSLRDAVNYLCWKYPHEYKRNKERTFYSNVSQALRELESSYPPPQKRQKSTDQTSSSSSLRSAADQASVSSDSDDDSCAEKKTGPWFSDIGGMNEVIEELKMNLIFPIRNLPYYCRNGARPVSGILLHGPPGCGKTMLARAIANEAGVPLYHISATEVVSGVSGASEEHVRSLFDKAHKTAPSVIFFDEIDAIGSKRENNQKQMECRIVTQLMTCMDEFYQPQDESESKSGGGGYVLVIGATNRPDAIDPALRRRFEEEIALDVPNESARIQILSALTRSFAVDASFDLLKIARATPGFVGSDLKTLTKKAANLAMRRDVNRIFPEESRGETWWRHVLPPEEMENVVSITMADFVEAAKIVVPSTRKEGFSAVPSVKWEDIGGLDSLRQLLKMAIVDRIKDPDYYEKSGLDFETGFLLYGPSGCGKTLIAQAVANEAGANFIYVKGPELLNKYVGESERYVRTIFNRARKCSPCIIFFDEIDALTKDRGQEGAWVEERLVGQLLIELDGAEQRRGVYVIGATNRPEVMDGALLRPGRLGEHIYVPLPGPEDRGLILKTLAKRKRLDADVDLLELGRSKSCRNFSGADLASLVKKAVQAACLDRGSSSLDEGVIIIKADHFQQALSRVTPSVSKQKRQYYKKLSQQV